MNSSSIESVGDSVGLAVGDTEAEAEVGTLVGRSVVSTTGDCDGAPVGELDDPKVGDPVAAAVGAPVGVPVSVGSSSAGVGDPVGAEVEASVGEALGLIAMTGDPVCAEDGLAVGEFVGALVGAPVGSTVSNVSVGLLASSNKPTPVSSVEDAVGSVEPSDGALVGDSEGPSMGTSFETVPHAAIASSESDSSSVGAALGSKVESTDGDDVSAGPVVGGLLDTAKGASVGDGVAWGATGVSTIATGAGSTGAGVDDEIGESVGESTATASLFGEGLASVGSTDGCKVGGPVVVSTDVEMGSSERSIALPGRSSSVHPNVSLPSHEKEHEFSLCVLLAILLQQPRNSPSQKL